jgi:hypothetical protein
MPRWHPTTIMLIAIPLAVAVAARLSGLWARQRYPGVARSIWLTGVVVPLMLAAITVVVRIFGGYWDYLPTIFAIWIGTAAWVARTINRDPAPVRWGSPSDLLGRLAIANMAACTALLGVIESQARYGSPTTVKMWYASSIVMVVMAVALKPAWVRVAFRMPNSASQGQVHVIGR